MRRQISRAAFVLFIVVLVTTYQSSLGFSVEGLLNNVVAGLRHGSIVADLSSWRYDNTSFKTPAHLEVIKFKRLRSCLYMEMNGGENNDSDEGGAEDSSMNSSENEESRNNNGGKKKKKKRPAKQAGSNQKNATKAAWKRSRSSGGRGGTRREGKNNVPDLLRRVTQLESLVASQAVELRKLREECRDLSEAAIAFAQVVELLRQAGLTMENYEGNISDHNTKEKKLSHPDQSSMSSKDNGPGSGKPKKKSNSSQTSTPSENIQDSSGGMSAGDGLDYEYYDDEEIFGTAPSSVTDAADAAGAAILAAMLAGKQRMLVDVRDAELTRDPDILVQFIELAILPVAAGLEGLKSVRNRVKIVFPTVSQLLQYRRTMALAAPEVVALSTLGFDPVAKQDNLVVIIAPAPDDEEGLTAINELLQPSDPDKRDSITQPVVVLNHHMVPVSGPAAEFEIAYHLRLLSVQYMSGDMAPEYMKFIEREKNERRKQHNKDFESQAKTDSGVHSKPASETDDVGDETPSDKTDDVDEKPPSHGEDGALEAAMNHASELGVNHGITRAMVIRAYPRPWHVFVDTSPDTDADFEVAATFDEEPSQDDVNYAIVECLEGSEREDELVAQQMQAALESGQLNKVSEMLGLSPDVEIDDESDDQSIDQPKNGNEEEDEDFDFFNEESL